jgi:quercetin dioxygenase-like cupin family protein
MADAYRFFDELTHEMTDIPADGIVSRTLYADDQIKVVLFGFAPGQELSEHTASVPATLDFRRGEAELTLGADMHPARAGTFVHMDAGLPHSVRATTSVVLLLTLLKGGYAEA